MNWKWALPVTIWEAATWVVAAVWKKWFIFLALNFVDGSVGRKTFDAKGCRTKTSTPSSKLLVMTAMNYLKISEFLGEAMLRLRQKIAKLGLGKVGLIFDSINKLAANYVPSISSAMYSFAYLCIYLLLCCSIKKPATTNYEWDQFTQSSNQKKMTNFREPPIAILHWQGSNKRTLLECFSSYNAKKTRWS